MADQATVSNLADTGKKSGHRYGKFTRAKNLSQATEKDMQVSGAGKMTVSPLFHKI